MENIEKTHGNDHLIEKKKHMNWEREREREREEFHRNHRSSILCSEELHKIFFPVGLKFL